MSFKYASVSKQDKRVLKGMLIRYIADKRSCKPFLTFTSQKKKKSAKGNFWYIPGSGIPGNGFPGNRSFRELISGKRHSGKFYRIANMWH